MGLKVYNTLTRKKEVFKPLDGNNVRMYVCGVTVYDYCHIGHARAYIAFDAVRRYLEYKGYAVTSVQNFTDVDDKIIKRAKETNKNPSDIAEQFIKEYFVDADALKIKRASVYPQATKYIDKMYDLIAQLIKNGKAYAVAGEVYYNVEAFSGYGKLSGRRLEDNEAGSRVKINPNKRNPYDFALWKKVAADELAWDSPWGRGRPGWHLECSVMSMDHLGESFDIHGGGRDLIFPHHENEIAQSEGATGQQYVKYWMHNGFVNIDNEKMSKSLGNFFTIRDVLKIYPAEVVRFFMLSTHYRSPINYSDYKLNEATKAMERILAAAQLRDTIFVDEDLTHYRTKFEDSMDDDFNTAAALGVLFELARYINISRSAGAVALLNELATIFEIFPTKDDTVLPTAIQEQVVERYITKAGRDFTAADAQRAQLLKLGYQVQDTSDGTEVVLVGTGRKWFVPKPG